MSGGRGWDGMARAEWVDVWAHLAGWRMLCWPARVEEANVAGKDTKMQPGKGVGCNVERQGLAWPAARHVKRQGEKCEHLKASSLMKKMEGAGCVGNKITTAVL
jgi:hypothetical protein